MDDTWARVVLVGSALVVAALMVWWQRRRSGNAPRRVDAPQLDPGVYFFSSTACRTCDEARRILEGRVETAVFTEVVWEDEPEVFDDLEISAVPAVLVLGRDRTGTLYSGRPPRSFG